MIETTKYMRKPFPVDGVQVTAENMSEIAAWCQGKIENTSEDGSGANYIKVPVHKPANPRQERAYIGDFVLFAGKGFKVYLEQAFYASFEAIAGAPTVMHGAPSEDPTTPVITGELPARKGPSPKNMPKKRSGGQRPKRVGNVGQALQEAQNRAQTGTASSDDVTAVTVTHKTTGQTAVVNPNESAPAAPVPANGPTEPAAQPVPATAPVEGPEAVQATVDPVGPAPVSNAAPTVPTADGTSTES